MHLISEFDDTFSPYALLRFYATTSYACSYLQGQTARSHVVAPSHLITAEVYSTLVNSGFRRSGIFTYRPGCDHCNACVSVRLNVEKFRPDRSQRRVRERHGNLTVTERPLEFNPVHYDLYCRYQSARHSGGSMETTGQDGQLQYSQFLLQSQVDTRLFEFSENGVVRMVCIVDLLTNGLSAVYTFYDPDMPRASLGTYAVLWQIEYCRQKALRWVYLGYWIKNSRKMNYKTRFRPIEGLIGNQWRELTDTEICNGL